MREDVFVSGSEEKKTGDIEEDDANGGEDDESRLSTGRFRGDSLSVFDEQEFCIATAHDFLRWFSKLEEDVRLDDFTPHLRYLAELKRAGSSCDELARDVS